MPDRDPTGTTPSNALARRLAPARRERPGLPVRTVDDRLPAAGDLPLAANPLRDACWDALPPGVAERLEDLAGERIEWWAAMVAVGPADRRPRAAVVGTSGIVLAEPRVDADHRPVHELARYAVDPASVRATHVVSRPRLPRWGAGRPGTDLVRPDAVPPTPGVDEGARHILANLPPQARDLLVAPFGEADPVHRSAFHYEGTTAYLGMFALVLVGARHATVATGSRTIPARHTERTAHWALRVVRAGVVGPATQEWIGA